MEIIIFGIHDNSLYILQILDFLSSMRFHSSSQELKN